MALAGSLFRITPYKRLISRAWSVLLFSSFGRGKRMCVKTFIDLRLRVAFVQRLIKKIILSDGRIRIQTRMSLLKRLLSHILFLRRISAMSVARLMFRLVLGGVWTILNMGFLLNLLLMRRLTRRKKTRLNLERTC